MALAPSRRTALVAALTAALALLAPGWVASVGAEPSRDDLAAAEERLLELESVFSRAVEAYNRTQDAKAELRELIAGREAEARALDEAIRGRTATVARLVRTLYRGGSVLGVEALLGAGEMREVVRRTAYLRSAQRSHRDVLEGFAADRVALAAALAELERAREREAALESELAARAEEIEARLAAQEDEVAQLRATIERLERERAAAAERAAREAAAREAARAERARRETPGATVAPVAAPAPAATPEPTAAEPTAPPATTAPEPTAPPAATAPEPTAAEPAAPEPAAAPAAAAAVEAARSQLGKPCRWGASGPDAYDCSGLTSWAWAQAGVRIPRSSGAQFAGLPKVDRAHIRPGDLLFFGAPIHHVGIYAGNGQMIEAPYSGQVVRYRSIERSDYAGAARPG